MSLGESVATVATQWEYSLSEAVVKARLSVVTAWMGDCLALDFAHEFPRSQIMCRLYTPAQRSFEWDCKPRSRVYTHANRSLMHAKDPGVHVRVRRIMETLKHPCILGFVARLCCNWFSMGKATNISHGKNSNGTIQLLKTKEPVGFWG